MQEWGCCRLLFLVLISWRVMNYQALLYSANDSITITDLKSGNYAGDFDVTRVKDWMDEHRVVCAVEGEDAYHHKFYNVRAKPYLYYSLWDISVLTNPLLAIVGPRKMSPYAQEVLEKLFLILQDYKLTTISGMADGVDSLCHSLSLRYHIPTVAILGSGLWTALSGSKKAQILSIAGAWCVVSEFRLGQKATSYTFPQRNRLIAWLSHCLFLPEAWEKSGSMLTVMEACRMHRVVYGAPQSIFCLQSAWLLRMMQKWDVKVVADLEEFVHSEFTPLEELWISSSLSDPDDCNDVGRLILQAISEMPWWATVDFLGDKLCMNISEVLWALTELEVRGLVRVTTHGHYCSM